MRSLLASLLGLLFVTGCASFAGYDRVCEAWVGRSADALVAKWGPPQGSYTMQSGERVLEWVDRSSYTSRIVVPTQSTAVIGGKVGTINGTQERVSEVGMECRTTFFVDTKGTITRWTTRGHCVA